MLRLVRTPEGPTHFLLCDDPRCMEARRGLATVANREELMLSKRTFIKNAIAEGWMIDIGEAYCPACMKERMDAVRAAEERAKQVIQPAAPAQVLAFGKGRP
jgi:hypothetical protein